VETQVTNIDFSNLWQQILTLLNEPTSNLTAAFLLYGIITLVLLLLIIIALMFLSVSDEDEDEESAEAASEREPSEADRIRAAIDATPSGEVVEGIPDVAPAARVQDAAPVPSAPPKVPLTPRARLVRVGIGLLILLVVWLVTGFSTSADVVCDSCHVITSHNSLDESIDDPHADGSCVRCHEAGGLVGRYFLNVPLRVVHFIDGSEVADIQGEYGTVTQSACLSCHRDVLDGVLSSSERGIVMSHTEPFDAGVRCIDCHQPVSGVVSTHNAGMNPCLRCHESQTASAECETCHDRTAAAAARASATDLASQQVIDISCGGCHDEAQQCDPCHGLRMPHTAAFKRVAHARAGAVDFWYNNGETCGKCHTATRNSCQRCHTSMLGQGHPASLATTHVNAAESACDRCHVQWRYQRGRDFCTDVCHTPEAIEQSPR